MAIPKIKQFFNRAQGTGASSVEWVNRRGRRGRRGIVKGKKIKETLLAGMTPLGALFFFLAYPAVAEEDPLAACSKYRSKKEGIPVYAEPSETAEVVDKLVLGEKVCYIGEKSKFAIIDWLKQPQISEKRTVFGKPELELAYVRLVDLWEPRGGTSGRPLGMFEYLKSYYYYLRSGGVPDDGLLPFRPLIEATKVQPLQSPEQAPEPAQNLKAGEKAK